MKMIQITDEYFEKFDDDVDFDKSEFNTEQEIEVRIPFEGYYSLKIHCKNPQVAMAEALKIDRDIGILSVVGSDMKIEDANIEETYAIISN